MFSYVYILKSLKNDSFYISYATDLKRRFKQHNNGESSTTKPFRPYKLIFYEAFLNKTDAKNREIYLKGGYGRKTISKLIAKYLISKNISNLARAERLSKNILYE